MRDNEYTTINIADFFSTLKRYWPIVAALFLVFLTVAFVWVRYATKDTYTATGVLYVSNKSAGSESGKSIQKSDIDTSKTISTTYIELLKTRDFLESVSKQLDLPYSWKDIKERLQVVPVGDTELLKVSVTTGDAKESYDIANCIIRKAPGKLMSIYDGGKAEIADGVYKPSMPDDKGLARKVALGGIAGIALGLIIVFLIYFFDRKIHSASAISNKYKVPILGEISQNHGHVRNRTRRNTAAEGIEMVLNDKTEFDTLETFKAIRTSVMFSVPKTEEGQVLAITSSCPGEGKTTTSINLAITFAQTGARVILVDCDLRKARVHRYLEIERKSGVSNVICGYIPLREAIKKDIRKNLDCLTAGEIPPNPAELLGTEKFSRILSELKKDYDYIFIDTPPLGVVTDATLVMKSCDGAIVVARENLTTFDMLDATMEDISTADAKLLGVVLLDSSEKQKKYGYYTGRYGYRNGYKYKYRYDYKYADDPREESVKGK